MKDEKSRNIMRFFKDMEDQDTRERLGRSLALIPPGRWDLFILWAEANGYVFHGRHIPDEFAKRPGLQKRIADHPVMSAWSNESLSAFAANEPEE